MSKAGFWDNPDEAQSVVSQLSVLKAIIEPVEEIQREAKDLNELFELATDESDEDELVQLEDDLSALSKRCEQIELSGLLSRPEDMKNCSLLNRCKLILDICEPPDVTAVYPDYAFDEATIKKLDMIRHEIIHSLQIDKPIENADDDILYLKKTGLFFLHLILQTFNLKIRFPILHKIFTKF